jgi:sigma-B regulation protein RsbU (phosphoserine phosphatase)
MIKTKDRSIEFKISRALIGEVCISMLCLCIVFAVILVKMRGTLIESNREMGETTEKESSLSMTDLSREKIMDIAKCKADLADNEFIEFMNMVKILASEATYIYENESDFFQYDVPLPDMSNDGKLAVQLLYSASTDISDQMIASEVGLLGNTQSVLLSVNNNFENMVSDYIATETGIMIQADYISGKKFDESGNIMPYEAKTRPWYIGAKETGKPFYTQVSKDAHTNRIGIMCGVPIMSNGVLKGVAGAGMYLDNVEAMVRNSKLGDTGDACIINQDGNVLFSTRSEGDLVARVGGADLRTTNYKELSEAVIQAVSGEKGVALIDVDGEAYYFAYAPMETVGWTFVIMISTDEVESPTKQLVANLDHVTEEAIDNANFVIKAAFVVVFIIFILICMINPVIASGVSDRIAMPIKKLTDSVKSIQGDSLEFVWNEDTGDEMQLLAESFSSLTFRIKKYIEDIRAITAEKERIGAELNVATQIQADMLPCIFPAFPEREEFDIHASMKPAKEVGGDFYDFFLLDDDHLALVMADVSGKGVPAALFMVISKTLIKDRSQMCRSPKTILEEVNNKLYESNAEGMFVTVWLGILEISTGKIVAANAGHEYPAIRGKNGNFELLKDKHGMMAGIIQDIQYTEYEIQLESGGSIFLYTDGVPEATDADGKLFGTDRMVNALNIDLHCKPKDLLENVTASIHAFVDTAPQFDDITIMSVTWYGESV